MNEERHSQDSSQLDERRGLLGNDDLEEKAADSGFDELPVQSCSIWRYGIIFASFVFTVVAIATAALVLFVRSVPLGAPESFIQDDGHSSIASRGQIAIPLNPALHATRPPTTLEYNWNITSAKQSPDGVEKLVYLVNGQFPGPTIEARSGDRIIVNVHNGLDDGVSLHWHGLELRGSNAMDGAVGYTQCPIPAGISWTYNFTISAHEHGTFWWHSHTFAQRGDGLYGGLIVHQPRKSVPPSEQDEALLMVSDWFHRSQEDVVAQFRSKASLGSEPTPDSMLLNGYGRYNCSMANKYKPIICAERPRDKLFPLLRNNTATRLRIVNAGTVAGVSVMMQGATLRPVEVDGGCKIDTEAGDSVGVLYPGERVDVNLDWKREDTSSWFNVYLDPENFIHTNYALNPNQTFAAVPNTLRSAEDRLNAPTVSTTSDSHIDLAAIISSPATTTSIAGVNLTEPANTVVMTVFSGPDQYYHGETRGVVNGISWVPQLPPLLALNRSAWDEHQNVRFIGVDASAPKRVNVIINNPDDGAHSFHLHGHSFYVLASFRSPTKAHYPGSFYPGQPNGGRLGALAGLGGWTNYQNPIRRDTVTVGRWGHVLISFAADNPGLWLIHCHMMVHQGAGMAAGFQIGDINDGDHVKSKNPIAAELCTKR